MKVEKRKKSRIRFKADYLSKSKPVILTDLYSNQPLGKIKTPNQAIAALGDIPIMVRGSYEGLFSKKDVDGEFSDIGSYIRHIRQNPGTDLYCSEQGTPEEILSLFQFPEESIIGPEQPISHLFLGPKGMRTIFHWDGDHRHVFLTQIFGRKRVYLVSPEHSPSMAPIFNLSGFNFHDLNQKQKNDFIRERRGWVAEIEPGETLYFPKGFWHYVEYIGNSMSINVRFRASLSEDLFSACNGLYQIQMLSHFIKNEATARKVAVELLRVFNRRYKDGLERYDAFIAALTVACHKHCPKGTFQPSLYPEIGTERLILETRAPSLSRKPGFIFDSPLDNQEGNTIHPAHQSRIDYAIKSCGTTPTQKAWFKKLLELKDDVDRLSDPQDAALLSNVMQFYPAAYMPE